MTLHVPAIDIAPFLSGDPDGKRAVVDAVRAACRDIGFLVIAGHGLPAEDLARTIHAHPTLSESLKEAALASDGRGLHSL